MSLTLLSRSQQYKALHLLLGQFLTGLLFAGTKTLLYIFKHLLPILNGDCHMDVGYEKSIFYTGLASILPSSRLAYNLKSFVPSIRWSL